MISLDRAGMESRFPGLLDAVLGAPDPESVSETSSCPAGGRTGT